MVTLVDRPYHSTDDGPGGRVLGLVRWVVVPLCLSFTAAAAVCAADLDEAAALLRTGQYPECARLATEAIRNGARGEAWYILQVQAEMAQGRYEPALSVLKEAGIRHPGSVRLYLVGREVRRFNDLAGRERVAQAAIERYLLNDPRRFTSPEDQIALGQFFLLRGADPKKVLDQFYDAVIKASPEYVGAYLASAELALEKQDYALAAETLRKAPREAASDPNYHFLMARAYTDDRAQEASALAEALKINPRHVDSLLLKADGLIDAERDAEAAKVLDQVIAVNGSEPRAWAYRAVLAHLRSDSSGEAAARQQALAPWKDNPDVDSLIGRKLAQKYRFAEGASYQRQALAMDPGYLPAKIQLSQTLLRLGEEAEGWKLVDEIFAADGYNVVAYNLMNLRDLLARFQTLTTEGIVLRMDPKEAALYGHRALSLLKRARETLCGRYGVTLPETVIVEIFPQKKEFAVRTFGLPGADGFLGVCFGRVITANSPASQGEHPSNWEAVLWHEFCHAVTLHRSRNKMPRWLSEGISVYEEGREDNAWATAFNPRFRAMILGKELTPLSQLSGAFLAPKSAMHVQFAYFESALAVEFLVGKAGESVLQQVLDDLGAGKSINEALPARTRMTLHQLDEAFAAFARKKAEAVASGVTWEPADLAEDATLDEIAAWLKARPRNFPGRLRLAARLVAEKKWPEARAILLELKASYPGYLGADNPYMMLARVYRNMAATADEHGVLEELAKRDGDAVPAQLRLMELDEAAANWEGVARNAHRVLAVNPLIPAPYRALARAADQLHRTEEAIAAYRGVAALDDSDPAEVHFRLARLLSDAGKKPEARREVLKSLEEAPRFRDSHRLLLELAGDTAAPKAERERPTVPNPREISR